MSEVPTPPRRKMGTDPKTGLDIKMTKTASLLENTYRIVRQTHENQVVPVSRAYLPGKFRNDFGVSDSFNKIETPESKAKSAQPRRRMDVWLKVAKLVIDRRFDPELFIRRQFQVLAPGDRSPMPEMMLHAQAIANYENAHTMLGREVAIALRSNASTFESEVGSIVAQNLRHEDGSPFTDQECWARVLADPEMELSALFRYCMALSIARDKKTLDRQAFQNIAATFRTVAALQYVSASDAYDTSWNAILPENYSVTAMRIYDSYYGRQAG